MVRSIFKRNFFFLQPRRLYLSFQSKDRATLGYEHGILITFLPTRAPELNPIEQMWHILVQRLKNIALMGPGQNHSHQAARAVAKVMNEFTHLDVQACYCSSGYLSKF